jgi:hypothetical protein
MISRFLWQHMLSLSRKYGARLDFKKVFSWLIIHGLSGGSSSVFYSLQLHLWQEKAFSGNCSTAVDGLLLIVSRNGLFVLRKKRTCCRGQDWRWKWILYEYLCIMHVSHSLPTMQRNFVIIKCNVQMPEGLVLRLSPKPPTSLAFTSAIKYTILHVINHCY